MHHYGGGYSDIKRTTGSWVKAFDDMDETTWANGYLEIHPAHIAYTPHRPLWKILIGNCAFIFRSHTLLSEMVYADVNMVLDSKLSALKKNPAVSLLEGSESGSGYPVEWNELMGRIFHRIQPAFLDRRIKTSVPRPDVSNYR
jgi:hypothetical protein